jgi:hypothetical protein
MTKNNDTTIKALISKIEEKKSALGVKPKANWKTNAIFKYDSQYFMNLNTISEIEPIVDALSFLYIKYEATKKAYETLGISAPIQFTWTGYTIAEWESDFKTKVTQIYWEAENKKLKELEAKLRSLVSEEVRTEMELESISKLLG